MHARSQVCAAVSRKVCLARAPFALMALSSFCRTFWACDHFLIGRPLHIYEKPPGNYLHSRLASFFLIMVCFWSSFGNGSSRYIPIMFRSDVGERTHLRPTNRKSMLRILPLNAFVAGLRAKADVIALAGVIAMCLKS